MEHVAHIAVRRDPIPGEVFPEEVGLSEVLILLKEDIAPMVPRGDKFVVSERFEVHVAPAEGGRIAVFEGMSAHAIRLAFEEFADVI